MINDIGDKVYPRLLENNIEYFREENEGYLTIVPLIEKGLKDEVFNQTVKYILASCNGSNSIKDIIESLCDIYPEINRLKISEDVFSTLRYFKQLDVIDTGRENLAMNKIYKIGNGYTVTSTNEENYQEIVDLVKFAKVHSEIYHEDIFHSPDTDEELELAIRYNLFSFSSEFYLLKKDNDILGLISVIVRPLKNSTVSFLNYFICLDKTMAAKFLNTVIENINTISLSKITKVVANLEDNKEDKLRSYLLESNFIEEAYLKNEIEENSLFRMAYVI